MDDIPHQGLASFNPDPHYNVFRNVKSYGAKGDGVTDDAAAINAAISDGDRCGFGGDCDGATTIPATVYFPAGFVLSHGNFCCCGTCLLIDFPELTKSRLLFCKPTIPI